MTARSFFVSMMLTVDLDAAPLAASEAVLAIGSGQHVTVSDEETAREVLRLLGCDQAWIDSQIRFGQTGRV